jgi:hypothetical protein
MAGGRLGRGMSVRVHIDRVVLDGISVSAAGRPHLRAAIESELARLIAAGGISPELAGGIAVPSVRAPEMSFAGNAEPAQIGRRIAHSVYAGVGGRR